MSRIVPATAETDFSAVAKLYYTTWQVAYRGLIPQAYLDSLTPKTWHPEKRQANTLLAMEGTQIVGVCTFGPARLPEYRGIGEVYSLYVHPNFQHRGIGRNLLRAAQVRLDERYSSYYLVVLTGNTPAISLYVAAGFVQTGIHHVETTPYGNLNEEIFIHEPNLN